MTSKHLVHPELVEFLDLLPALEINDDTLAHVREGLVSMYAPKKDYADPNVSIERLTIPSESSSSELEVLVFTPKNRNKPSPGMLHIHGGGFIIGTAEIANPINVLRAAELGCVIVSVEYRLAPEVKAPGAVEDCYAALKWLHNESTALGIDKTKIAICGESAGGGLAANLTHYARDRREFPICFQVLIYPMLDDRTVSAAIANKYVGEFGWTRDHNAFAWKAILGQAPGLAHTPPYAAAARQSDLSALPPAYIYTGALDLFLEEDVAYAMRLLKAGVPVELHVFPGAYHGFDTVPGANIADRAVRESIEALAQAFAD